MEAMAQRQISPFPGMDPYLERRWPSVHTRLATYMADRLNDVLPDDLVAEAEERAEIVPAEDQVRPRASQAQRKPDVQVSALETAGGPAVATAAEVQTPLVLTLLDPEPALERYVRVVSLDDDRVITAIEFLSPSNKKPPGLTDYRRKRALLLAGGANVMEVDLTRDGNWRRLMGNFAGSDDALTSYRVAIRLPGRPENVFLVPIRLRDRLPKLAVPLRQGDPQVTVDLQSLLEEVYAKAQYGRRIDYARPPEPPLSAEDEDWADALLRGAGRRV